MGDRPGLIRAAFVLIRVSLQERLVYRLNLVIGLFGALVMVLVFRHLWISLYGEREVYAGVTLDQTLTYATVSIIVACLFPSRLEEINDRIREGDIVFDITRPMYYGSLLLFQAIGQTMAMLVVSSLPLVIAICLLTKIVFPLSLVVWVAFLISLVLGFLIHFLIDFIASLLGFWITEMNGVLFAKNSIVSILGGTYIPIWVFPSTLRQVMSFLPFQGICYTPLSIFVGKTELHQIPEALGIQIVWIVILAGLSKHFFASAIRKLSVQGG